MALRVPRAATKCSRFIREQNRSALNWNWIIGIFSAPRATFSQMRPSITWKDMAVPFLLVVVVTLGTQAVMGPLAMDEQIERILQRDDLSVEQQEQFIERMEHAMGRNSGLRPYVISTLVRVAWFAVLGGVVMFFGAFVLGGEAAFTGAMAIVVFSSLIGLVEMAVKVPLMLQAGSTRVETGLALLLPGSMRSTLVYRFFHRLDFFIMWKVGLTALGTALFFRVPEKPARLAFFGAWAAVMFLLAWLLDSRIMAA